MSFTHYIFCRYNLTLFSDNVYGIEDPMEWMERRRHYFAWLLMSLGVQTCQNFHFVLFVDANTPSDFIEELDDAINKNVEDYQIFEGNHEDWIKQHKTKSDWVITSRIDCDDYYNEDFVKVIQDNFKEESEILDVKGLQYDSNGDDFYTSGRSNPNSPFITLIESNKDIKTVYEIQHTFMPTKYKSRFAGDAPLYVQVIHDENISNKIMGVKI